MGDRVLLSMVAANLAHFSTFLALDLGGTNMFVKAIYQQDHPEFNALFQARL